MKYIGLNEKYPQLSLAFGTQFMMLFRESWLVQPCWRNYVTGEGFDIKILKLLAIGIFCFARVCKHVSSQLLLPPAACCHNPAMKDSQLSGNRLKETHQ